MGDSERALERLGHDEYDVKGDIRQERAAYMTNLAAQVRRHSGGCEYRGGSGLSY